MAKELVLAAMKHAPKLGRIDIPGLDVEATVLRARVEAATVFAAAALPATPTPSAAARFDNVFEQTVARAIRNGKPWSGSNQTFVLEHTTKAGGYAGEIVGSGKLTPAAVYNGSDRAIREAKAKYCASVRAALRPWCEVWP